MVKVGMTPIACLQEPTFLMQHLRPSPEPSPQY